MKNAIIIGASSGIGKATALLLAQRGYRVGITGRRLHLLEQIREADPVNIHVHSFDVNTLTSDTHLKVLAETLGGIDLILYCSGVGEFNKNLDFAIEKKMIDTNVTAFTQVADWAVTYFQKQKSGSFASITSLAGMMGSRHAPAYNASKAFQINYLKGLRQIVKKNKLPISIIDLRTGFVDTPMAKAQGKFWVASPDKAANQIVRAIEQNSSVAYITRRWRIIGFLLKIFA